MEQRTPEWHVARMGIPTASEFDKIVTPTGKLSTQRAAYMHRLLFEYMTGIPIDDPESYWMNRGIELEDQAIGAYEMVQGVETARVGLITTDDGLVAASPDRLVGADGLMEQKCLSPGKHMAFMIEKDAERGFWPQVQGQLFVSEREWVDLVSYHPLAPLAIRRVTRDEKWLAVLAPSIKAFTDEMLELRLMLEREFGPFNRPNLNPKPKDPDDPGALGITNADLEALFDAYRADGRLPQ